MEKMNRRKFIRKTAIGTTAIAIVPSLVLGEMNDKDYLDLTIVLDNREVTLTIPKSGDSYVSYHGVADLECTWSVSAYSDKEDKNKIIVSVSDYETDNHGQSHIYRQELPGTLLFVNNIQVRNHKGV